MCITLPTWINMFDSEPAVVFTFRHPMEVAISLHKRDPEMSLERGLKLWIEYNVLAVKNSANLCVVPTSNDIILSNPIREAMRISSVLSARCNVVAPPQRIPSKTVVDAFIDQSLQHNAQYSSLREGKVLRDFGGGCTAREYQSDHPRGSTNQLREEELYFDAMRLFCDFRNGEAFRQGYSWPQFPEMF